MKNAIRCCISCILPCGALDVVRIVHANGRVQEISRTVKAAEIMKLHPKHVLKKPSASADDHHGTRPKIAVVPPDADLKRGRIYFLMPLPPPPDHKNRPKRPRKKKELSSETTDHKKCTPPPPPAAASSPTNNIVTDESLLISDRYLTEILSEKIATQRERRRGRTGVWRPHLQSISEIPLIDDD